MEATITSKGQITLPKALREALHLKQGDKIVFEETGDHDFILKPRTLAVQSLKGILQHKGAPVSIEEMQKAIENRSS